MFTATFIELGTRAHTHTHTHTRTAIFIHQNQRLLTRVHFKRGLCALQVADKVLHVFADGQVDMRASRLVVAHQQPVQDDEDDLENQQEERKRILLKLRNVHLAAGSALSLTVRTFNSHALSEHKRAGQQQFVANCACAYSFPSRPLLALFINFEL